MPKIFKERSILNILKQNQLLRGSAVMFVGTMVANFGSYLYHLLMGRMLGPKSYGALESVISLGYLLFILIAVLTFVVTKFVAKLKGKKDMKGIAWIFRYFNQKMLIFSGFIMLIIFIISPLVKSFLRLDSVFPIVFLGLLFFVSVFSTIDRAILQGLMNFNQMVVSHIGETGSKMVAALFLVWLGLGVNGAILALVIGGMTGYFLANIYLKSIKKIKVAKPDISTKDFLKFGLPVFLVNLSFTSLYTNDIILVKHFFPAYEAGIYAALAVLGKIIFFATSSIPMVVFPMAAHRHSQGKKTRHILNVSLLMVFAVSLGIVLVYRLFPGLMISILFGKEYLSASPLLVWMGIFISLYSLAYLLINYFLSTDKTRIVILPIIFALIQLVLISKFHQSLFQSLQISVLVSGLLLLGLMIYYLYEPAKTLISHHPRL